MIEENARTVFVMNTALKACAALVVAHGALWCGPAWPYLIASSAPLGSFPWLGPECEALQANARAAILDITRREREFAGLSHQSRLRGLNDFGKCPGTRRDNHMSANDKRLGKPQRNHLSGLARPAARRIDKFKLDAGERRHFATGLSEGLCSRGRPRIMR